ncbi:hypothetical protein SMICM17S_13311 [Streptomyces microflavus]
MRRFQMMPSRIGLSSDAPKPRWEATADQTSGTEIRAGPIVTATATESSRSRSPPVQISAWTGAPTRRTSVGRSTVGLPPLTSRAFTVGCPPLTP